MTSNFRVAALVLGLVCFLSAQRSEAASFVAFNDFSPGILTHSNANTIWIGKSGVLKDIASGKPTPVTLTITTNSVVLGGVQGQPTYGTPASVLFYGFVDFSGQDTPSIEMDTTTDVVTYTFSGLDPDQEYNFQGTAVRGHFAYKDRWSLFELVGARGGILHPTPGVLTRAKVSGLNTNQVAINTGDNNAGDVAWWEHIVPALDGTFSVTSKKYGGAVPGGSSGGARGYGMVAVRLESAPTYTGRASLPPRTPNQQPASIEGIQNVFLIVMENHDWSSIQGSDFCPYINKTLLPISSYATNYFSEPGVHPSEPNYIWMIAGTNFNIRSDDLPSVNKQSSTNTLFHQLDAAGISWKSYQEDISGTNIPSSNTNNYVARHNPCMFFNPARTNLDYATNHNRPFYELALDLTNNTVPRFSFISPNLTNDMHNTSSGSPSSRKQGDDWLKRELPKILNSQTFTNGGAVFLTWDEGTSDGDGPMGMLLISPRAKGHGYHNGIFYTHSSLLRTMQDIFGLRPYLADAQYATPLTDLFLSLSLGAAEWQEDGLHLKVLHALPGQPYRLEATSDPGSGEWVPVAQAVAPDGVWEWVVPELGSEGEKFYRVSSDSQ